MNNIKMVKMKNLNLNREMSLKDSGNMTKTKALIKIVVLPILLVLIHLLVLYKTNLYALFPFLDIPMHFIGGLVLAISFIFFTRTFNITFNKKGDIILGTICFIGLCAISVEFVEFLSFGAFRLGLNILDVVQDLFFALMGGLFLIGLTNKNL